MSRVSRGFSFSVVWTVDRVAPCNYREAALQQDQTRSSRRCPFRKYVLSRAAATWLEIRVVRDVLIFSTTSVAVYILNWKLHVWLYQMNEMNE